MPLNFDYSGESELATYRGFTVKAMRDDSPSNPFKEWDSEPYLAVNYDRSLTEYGDGGLDPMRGVSDSWINRNWRKAAGAIGCDIAAMVADMADRARGERIADARRDYLEGALDESRPSRYGGNAGDYFESVAALWRMRGVEALASSSSGYSQGDYAECLAVALPEWADKVGAPRATHAAQLASAVKLYGAWAWGDVYGWEIISPAGDELDSCWGYYGSDHEESGLADAARDSIDSSIASASKARGDKLKELIRNRVPLYLRGAILADAGKYEGSF